MRDLLIGCALALVAMVAATAWVCYVTDHLTEFLIGVSLVTSHLSLIISWRVVRRKKSSK